MTSGHARSARKTGKPPRKLRSGFDRPIYIAVLLIWAFASALAYVMSPEAAPTFAAAFATAWSLYLVASCVRVFRGDRLTRWQRGLASLPLALAGARARAPESLRRTPEARRAVVIAAVLAIVMIGATIAVAVFSLD